jgi:hypothetical protein
MRVAVGNRLNHPFQCGVSYVDSSGLWKIINKCYELDMQKKLLIALQVVVHWLAAKNMLWHVYTLANCSSVSGST